MKQRIKIVFQEEYNLENQIGISKRRNKISNKQKQKFSDDEIQVQSDQYDLSEEFHDWELDFVITSPNSKFIAFNISKENYYEERRYFHIVIDTKTKKIRYEKNFLYNSNMLFTYDSKYLIIDDDQGNFLVDLETFKELSIDKKGDSIISIDQENNIYKLNSKNSEINKLQVFSISDQSQKTVNIIQLIFFLIFLLLNCLSTIQIQLNIINCS